jgi:hypothetical protein
MPEFAVGIPGELSEQERAHLSSAGFVSLEGNSVLVTAGDAEQAKQFVPQALGRGPEGFDASERDAGR